MPQLNGKTENELNLDTELKTERKLEQALLERIKRLGRKIAQEGNGLTHAKKADMDALLKNYNLAVSELHTDHDPLFKARYMWRDGTRISS